MQQGVGGAVQPSAAAHHRKGWTGDNVPMYQTENSEDLIHFIDFCKCMCLHLYEV